MSTETKVFKIQVGKRNPEDAKKVLSQLISSYKEEILLDENSGEIKLPNYNKLENFPGSILQYKNIKTGEVAEYDNVMGLWYIKGKWANPLRRDEVEKSEDWKEEYVIATLPVGNTLGFKYKFISFITGNKERPLTAEDKIFGVAALLMMTATLAALVLLIRGY